MPESADETPRRPWPCWRQPVGTGPADRLAMTAAPLFARFCPPARPPRARPEAKVLATSPDCSRYCSPAPSRSTQTRRRRPARARSRRIRRRTPGTSKSTRTARKSNWGTIPMVCWRAAPSPSTATARSRAPTSRPLTLRQWPARRPNQLARRQRAERQLDTLELGTIGTADGLSQPSSDYNISSSSRTGPRSAS